MKKYSEVKLMPPASGAGGLSLLPKQLGDRIGIGKLVYYGSTLNIQANKSGKS
jgi:hypothetical protein